MHNWYLPLLALLAILHPIACYVDRGSVDGREQCGGSNFLRRETRQSYGTFRFQTPSRDRRLTEIRHRYELNAYPADRNLADLRTARESIRDLRNSPAQLSRAESQRERTTRAEIRFVPEAREITNERVRQNARERYSRDFGSRLYERDTRDSSNNKVTDQARRTEARRTETRRDNTIRNREIRNDPQRLFREARDLLQRTRADLARPESRNDRRAVREALDERRAFRQRSESRLDRGDTRRHRSLERQVRESDIRRSLSFKSADRPKSESRLDRGDTRRHRSLEREVRYGNIQRSPSSRSADRQRSESRLDRGDTRRHRSLERQVRDSDIRRLLSSRSAERIRVTRRDARSRDEVLDERQRDSRVNGERVSVPQRARDQTRQAFRFSEKRLSIRRDSQDRSAIRDSRERVFEDRERSRDFEDRARNINNRLIRSERAVNRRNARIENDSRYRSRELRATSEDHTPKETRDVRQRDVIESRRERRSLDRLDVRRQTTRKIREERQRDVVQSWRGSRPLDRLDIRKMKDERRSRSIERREREVTRAVDKVVNMERELIDFRVRTIAEKGNRANNEPQQSIWNVQYLFYTLQAIYLCGLLIQMTEQGSKKTQLSWWPANRQTLVKVD